VTQGLDAPHLRTVLNTVVDGVMLIDKHGTVRMFNAACERLFGYARDEVINQNVKMLMPSPFHEEHDRYLANYQRTGERKVIGIGREVVGRRKNGTTFPMDLSVGETTEDDGEPVFVGVIHDLTERKRGEQALREAAEGLRAVVDTAVDGVILIDARGVVRMFNPACERLFGYAQEDVIGQNVKMLMPSPFHGEHDHYLANYHRTGERKIIGIGREVVGRRKDGTTFPMDLSVGETQQGGESVFVGIIHDLTERKSHEQAQREAASRVKAVVDTAVDGVILIDASGIVQMFNPACERLFGYRAHEVIGQNVKTLMPSPFRDEHDRYLDNFHKTGERKIIGIGREVIGQRKDGTTFPMDLSVGEARQEGQSIFVGIIHDLTERKRTEAQLVQAQKMETVGQLSGGIAHDFNNLLTVMIGNAETLSDKLKVRPDLRQLSDHIISAGERGAQLTQRLLAFSRRQALQPIKIDCNELVDGMQLLLSRTLREDVAIKAMLDPNLPAAYADPGQLESAILNLALNAQDAMPGGGNLTLSTSDASLDERYQEEHPEVRAGDYVMIAVTDDGEGMTPDVLDRVFEPFFTTKEVGKGSGLGLSMVYGFVKQSNGHVGIYSEPGLGTTVRLYLPAAAREHPETLEELPPPEKRAPTGHETVLLAEDDPFVRSYAITCLESLGYRVVTAANGREALAHFNKGAKVDILFTDLVMPGGISGWELAEQAKKIAPGLRVLMTSGYPLETLAARGHAHYRANGNILNKPYRKADLARRLREVLEAPQAEAE
jgi:PAS domain S-box-containing protein